MFWNVMPCRPAVHRNFGAATIELQGRDNWFFFVAMKSIYRILNVVYLRSV
jgi:hypothetical protein